MKLDDGDEDGKIKIDLPQLPLSNTEEKVTVVLEEPHGSPSKLGSDRSCLVTIRHDRGEGIVEMGSNQVTCSSEDDEAHISVIRKFACAFAAQVQWSATDGDALFGKHYNLKEGMKL